ncbi:hypothetical protein ACFFK7_10005 [Pseudoalteromonas xiamenensis]|uniref:hypothetical protein n=1 Tax=Pseudoalteromonas xiamenensis TaxID=882626 RepID=UPI0035EB6B4A
MKRPVLAILVLSSVLITGCEKNNDMEQAKPEIDYVAEAQIDVLKKYCIWQAKVHHGINDTLNENIVKSSPSFVGIEYKHNNSVYHGQCTGHVEPSKRTFKAIEINAEPPRNE